MAWAFGSTCHIPRQHDYFWVYIRRNFPHILNSLYKEIWILKSLHVSLLFYRKVNLSRGFKLRWCLANPLKFQFHLQRKFISKFNYTRFYLRLTLLKHLCLCASVSHNRDWLLLSLGILIENQFIWRLNSYQFLEYLAIWNWFHFPHIKFSKSRKTHFKLSPILSHCSLGRQCGLVKVDFIDLRTKAYCTNKLGSCYKIQKSPFSFNLKAWLLKRLYILRKTKQKIVNLTSFYATIMLTLWDKS